MGAIRPLAVRFRLALSRQNNIERKNVGRRANLEEGGDEEGGGGGHTRIY